MFAGRTWTYSAVDPRSGETRHAASRPFAFHRSSFVREVTTQKKKRNSADVDFRRKRRVLLTAHSSISDTSFVPDLPTTIFIDRLSSTGRRSPGPPVSHLRDDCCTIRDADVALVASDRSTAAMHRARRPRTRCRSATSPSKTVYEITTTSAP